MFRDSDILAGQEHWLMPSQFDQFHSLGGNVVFSAVSPMESHVLYLGRPFGGVALIWQKDFQRWISPGPLVTGSSRLAAALVHAVRLRKDSTDQCVHACGLRRPTVVA